jgi:hypothetical protein
VLALQVRHISWPRERAAAHLNAVWSRVAADALAAAGWLRRTRCGLGGHMMVRHFEPGRLSLQCVGCGEQTPGWTIGTHGAWLSHRPTDGL